MAQRTSLNVVSPIAGISKRLGYQSSPAPFTCFDSTNYVGSDIRSGRSISGVRPPLVEFTPPPGTGPTNLLCRINGAVAGKPLQSIVAARDGDLYWWNANDDWTAATGAQASSLATDIPLFAHEFLQEVIIPNPGGKPFVFNYTTGACATMVETTSPTNTVPSDLRMFAVWQGALWGAGQLASPHILYASRIGDAHDWNFAAAATDEGRPFFTGGENEGRLRGPITAIMPHTSDVMIVSTVEGLVAFRAHPNGGIIDDLGSSYVLGQGACAKGPDDTLYFLSRRGLHSLPPQPGAVPALISEQSIPHELKGLAYDYENPTVSLEYDPLYNGLWLTIRGVVGQRQAWFYDLQTGGFHRQQFDDYPYALCRFDPIETIDHSSVLFGGAGYGGLARFDRFGVEDFASSIVIGPVAISPNAASTAKIMKATVIFGGDAPIGDGRLEVFVGANGEDCINRVLGNFPTFTHTLNKLQANNGVCYPMASGAAVAFRCSQNSGHNAIEEIQLDLAAQGVNRMTLFKNQTFSLACFGYVTATPTIGPGGEQSRGELDFTTLTQATGTMQVTGPVDLFDIAARAGSDADGSAGSGILLEIDLVDDTPDSAVWDGDATLTVTLDISGGADTIDDLVAVINAESDEWIASNVVAGATSISEGADFCEAFMDGGGGEGGDSIDVVSAAYDASLNTKTITFAEVTAQGDPSAALDMNGNIVVSVDDVTPTPMADIIEALNELPSIVATAGLGEGDGTYDPGTDDANVTATFAGGANATGLDDGMEIINAARFPQEWWDFCNADGSNVRVANEDNEFLPFDLLGFDAPNTEGSIVVRRPLPAEPTPLRIYICRSNTAKFPLGSDFHQFFAYPPWMLAIWPGGYGPNRANATEWELGPLADEGDVNPFSPNHPGGQGDGAPDECEPPEDSAVAMGMIRFPQSDSYMLFVGSEETARCDNPPDNPGDAGNPSVCFIARNDGEAGSSSTSLVSFGHAKQTSGVLDGTDNTELDQFTFDSDVTKNFVPFVRTLTGIGGANLDVDNQTVTVAGGLTGNPHDYFVWNDAASNMDKGDIATMLDVSENSLSNAETLFPIIATDAYEVDVLRHLINMLSPAGQTTASEEFGDDLEEKNEAQENYFGEWTWVDDPGPPHEP